MLASAYLRLARLPMGLLINFNAAILRGQIRRFVRAPPTIAPGL